MPLSLTEDDQARGDCKGGLGQEIFQPLPALLPGPLRINFDSVSSSQRRPKSSDRRIRRAVEGGRKDDRILGRGNQGNFPPLQVERNRDGEDADARFRSLRLEPNDVVDQNAGLANQSEGDGRTLPGVYYHRLSRRRRSRGPRGKSRSSAPSTRGWSTGHWRRLRALDGRSLDSGGGGSCQRCPCWAD